MHSLMVFYTTFSVCLHVDSNAAHEWRCGIFHLCAGTLKVWIQGALHILNFTGHGDACLESQHLGAGEMAQRLRALSTLLEDLGSIISTHMAAYGHL